jgi:putative transposase
MPHRKTCKRHNNPGDAHALTFSCFQRQPFLSKDRSRQWLIEAIDRARDKLHFHVWAYVIMPEHAHLLVWPTEAVYDISDVLNSIKQSVAKRALLFVQKHAPEFLPRMEDRQPNGDVHYRFWQRGGGYDRNICEPPTAFEQENTCTTIRCAAACVPSPRTGSGPVPRTTPACGPGRCASTARPCRW